MGCLGNTQRRIPLLSLRLDCILGFCTVYSILRTHIRFDVLLPLGVMYFALSNLTLRRITTMELKVDCTPRICHNRKFMIAYTR
jgi:hypothetical protein